jgi:hypothetical protein
LAAYSGRIPKKANLVNPTRYWVDDISQKQLSAGGNHGIQLDTAHQRADTRRLKSVTLLAVAKIKGAAEQSATEYHR